MRCTAHNTHIRSHASMFVTSIFAFFFLQVILPNQCCVCGLVLLMSFSSLNNIIEPISADIHLRSEANENFNQEIHSLHWCAAICVVVAVCSYKYRSCIFPMTELCHSTAYQINSHTVVCSVVHYTIHMRYIVPVSLPVL